MAETAAPAAVEQIGPGQQQMAAHAISSADGHPAKQVQHVEQLLLHGEVPGNSLLLQGPQWQQLCRSIAELDSTSDLLVQLVHNSRQQVTTTQQEEASASLQHEQPITRQLPGTPDSSKSTGDAVDTLQQQLLALLAEKQRIEADRQEMALQQGKYKGTIAQVRHTEAALLIWA